MQSDTGKVKSSRQKFTPEEDNMLRSLVQELGDKAWKRIANRIGTRTTRQCRERYNNYLSPNLVNGSWTRQEDLVLISKVMELGPKWSLIVKFFNYRSDVNIKNRYSLLVSKGVADPVTKPSKKPEIPEQSEQKVEITQKEPELSLPISWEDDVWGESGDVEVEFESFY